MNREQRRDLIKQGASKENIEKMDFYNSPCTIVEATQISRGVAEDVVTDYDRQMKPLQVSMSLQIELLKSMLFEAGILDEPKFREMYMEKAQEFSDKQKEMMEQSKPEVSPKVSAKMSTSDTDIDIKVIK